MNSDVDPTRQSYLDKLREKVAPIDPLRRVWVPIEDKNGRFMTHDREVYVRDQTTGAIRRARPKLKGKAARRFERKLRRLDREEHKAS